MFRCLAFAFPVVTTVAVTFTPIFAQGQDAVRLGPQPARVGPRPRVVEVQASEPASNETPASATETPEAAPPAGGVLNQAARLAAAKEEIAARQLARLAPYNLYAQPGDAVYFESDVLPPAQQIRPVRVGAGVQRYQPDSSFSHVIENALDNQQRAQLERQAALLNPPAAREQRAPEAIVAELQLIEARRANVQQRMAKLSNMSSMTYSSLYRNLADKLQLEAYELQLQQESAEAELAK